MKSSSYGFVRAVVVLLASATLTLAQTSGRYNGPPQYQNQTVPAPESVRPGALNYVEGQVSTGGEQVTAQAVGHTFLQAGQTLETDNGYAEILLTPGAFLRVGQNSEVSLVSEGLAATSVNVIHGEAMIEADQVIKGTQLEVVVGNSTADVLKGGLYDFNVRQQTMRVLDGKIKVTGNEKSREIGKGDQVALAQGYDLKKSDFNLTQAKQEPLYVWSEARSRDEAGQNMMLARNNYGYLPVNAGWFWDPYANYWGFWPASAYLYSPFGFGLYGGFYPGYYGYPGYVYGRPYYRWHGAAAVHAYGGGFHSAGGGGGFHGGGGGGGHR